MMPNKQLVLTSGLASANVTLGSCVHRGLTSRRPGKGCRLFVGLRVIGLLILEHEG